MAADGGEEGRGAFTDEEVETGHGRGGSENGGVAGVPDLARDTVCYVCGPPAMTDEFVADLKGIVEPDSPPEGGNGNGKERVLSEKWW